MPCCFEYRELGLLLFSEQRACAPIVNRDSVFPYQWHFPLPHCNCKEQISLTSILRVPPNSTLIFEVELASVGCWSPRNLPRQLRSSSLIVAPSGSVIQERIPPSQVPGATHLHWPVHSNFTEDFLQYETSGIHFSVCGDACAKNWKQGHCKRPSHLISCFVQCK